MLCFRLASAFTFLSLHSILVSVNDSSLFFPHNFPRDKNTSKGRQSGFCAAFVVEIDRIESFSPKREITTMENPFFLGFFFINVLKWEASQIKLENGCLSWSVYFSAALIGKYGKHLLPWLRSYILIKYFQTAQCSLFIILASNMLRSASCPSPNLLDHIASRLWLLNTIAKLQPVFL